jgi:hypothetical protein
MHQLQITNITAMRPARKEQGLSVCKDMLMGGGARCKHLLFRYI